MGIRSHQGRQRKGFST